MNVGDISTTSLVTAESSAGQTALARGQKGASSAGASQGDAWTAEAAHDPKEDKAILAEAESYNFV